MEERYLIIKPSSLGDVIHAFPAVSLLAELRPQAKIDWVVVPAFADIVKLHPAVDRIIPFRRKELGSISTFPSAVRELIREIRKTEYTAVFDLQGLLRSGLIAALAKTKKVAGHKEPKEKIAKLFYHSVIDSGPQTIHAVKRNLRLISTFFGTEKKDFQKTEFLKNESAAQKISEMLSVLPKGKIVAIAPGARWPSKRWDLSFFQRSSELLKEKLPECSFLLLGAGDEKKLAEELLRTLPGPTLDLTGKTTVAELLEAIRASDVLFCNDSGPMHIAAALGVPVTAMFAPTDPVRTGPYSECAEVLLPEDLPCMKCFKYDCQTPLCHQAIPPEKAAETLYRILTGGKA